MQTCRKCGCTDLPQMHEVSMPPAGSTAKLPNYWVEEDLCSVCNAKGLIGTIQDMIREAKK